MALFFVILNSTDAQGAKDSTQSVVFTATMKCADEDNLSRSLVPSLTDRIGCIWNPAVVQTVEFNLRALV